MMKIVAIIWFETGTLRAIERHISVMKSNYRMSVSYTHTPDVVFCKMIKEREKLPPLPLFRAMRRRKKLYIFNLHCKIQLEKLIQLKLCNFSNLLYNIDGRRVV
jgi:hypothetical protein